MKRRLISLAAFRNLSRVPQVRAPILGANLGAEVRAGYFSFFSTLILRDSPSSFVLSIKLECFA